MNTEILMQELRQCQDTLLFIKSISGIGVHDYDILSGDIQWDQRVRELWGVPSNMPVNYNVFMQGLHPDDRAKTQSAVDNSLEPSGNGHYEAEYRVINLTDKKTRWIAANGKTFFENGRAVRLLGTVRDITASRQKEEALRESEERFRIASKNSSFVPAQFDRDLRYQWIYNAHPDFNPAQVIGKRDDELDDSVGARRLVALKQKVIDSGKGIREEICFQRTDGMRAYDFTIEPLRDGGGSVVGGMSATFDITERKRAEEKLRESEELARRRLGEIEDLYRNAPVGLCVLDRNLRFLRINERLAEINGIPAADHIGKTVRDLLPGLAGAVEPEMRRILETGEPRLNIEIISETPAHPGLQRSWLEQWLPIKDSEGRVSGLSIVVEEVTERKRAEEALKQKETDLREAQRLAHIGSWHWDAKTDVTTGTDELLRIYGIDPEKESMPTFGEQKGRCYPETEWKRLNEAVQETMRTGIGYELDVQAIRSGESFWVTTRSEVVRDADGRIVGLRGTVQDITQRKQAEEALAAAHGQIQSIIDNTTSIVYALDPEERFVMANAPLAKLLNSTPEQMIGKRRHEFMPRKDADWHEANDRQVFEAGKALEFEEYSQLKGRSITWLTTKFPLRDMKGKIYAVAGISADISERKRAEQALQESENRLRLAHQVANIGAFERDIQTGTNFWSPELEAMYGLMPGDFDKTQGSWEQLVHHEDRVAAAGLVTQALESAQPVAGEWRVIWRDGSIHWIQGRFQAFKDAEGKPLRLIGVNIDITERKNSEKTLQESQTRLKILNENLENMVVQRTQQVRNLSKELTIAEQRERRRFSVVLHEDLQQTLFSAKMLIDMVDCASVEDAQEIIEDIHQVRQSIGKAIATTKSLAVELNPPILKNEGLDAALLWLAWHMQERYGLVICIDISKEFSIVKGIDQILVVQLVRELLYNIVRHAQTTDVVISGVRSGDSISVSIEDKGIGFDVAAWRNRASGSEKMGLFSIEERLRLFGGRLDVQSQAGKGTRITIVIPLTILESATS